MKGKEVAWETKERANYHVYDDFIIGGINTTNTEFGAWRSRKRRQRFNEKEKSWRGNKDNEKARREILKRGCFWTKHHFCLIHTNQPDQERRKPEERRKKGQRFPIFHPFVQQPTSTTHFSNNQSVRSIPFCSKNLVSSAQKIFLCPSPFELFVVQLTFFVSPFFAAFLIFLSIRNHV
jgi:hypothetical protein